MCITKSIIITIIVITIMVLISFTVGADESFVTIKQSVVGQWFQVVKEDPFTDETKISMLLLNDNANETKKRLLKVYKKANNKFDVFIMWGSIIPEDNSTKYRLDKGEINQTNTDYTHVIFETTESFMDNLLQAKQLAVQVDNDVAVFKLEGLRKGLSPYWSK